MSRMRSIMITVHETLLLSRSNHCFDRGRVLPVYIRFHRVSAPSTVRTRWWRVTSFSINRMRLCSSNAFDLHVWLSEIKLFRSRKPELCMIPPFVGHKNRVVMGIFFSCCSRFLFRSISRPEENSSCGWNTIKTPTNKNNKRTQDQTMSTISWSDLQAKLERAKQIKKHSTISFRNDQLKMVGWYPPHLSFPFFLSDFSSFFISLTSIFHFSSSTTTTTKRNSNWEAYKPRNKPSTTFAPCTTRSTTAPVSMKRSRCNR